MNMAHKCGTFVHTELCSGRAMSIWNALNVWMSSVERDCAARAVWEMNMCPVWNESKLNRALVLLQWEDLLIQIDLQSYGQNGFLFHKGHSHTMWN